MKYVLLFSLFLYQIDATSFFADALFWKASEETTSIVATTLSARPKNTSVFEPNNISFDWGRGFRVGGGYTSTQKGLETELIWTWFRTEARKLLPDRGDIILIEFFGGFIDQFTPATKNISESGRVRWSLLYNMFDWRLGRAFYATPLLEFRPYMGIKGGWIHQSIASKWRNKLDASPFTQFKAQERLKNNFWGVGPSIGSDSTWKLFQGEGKSLSLIGNFGSAMMWGSWECTDLYTNSLSNRLSVNMKDAQLGSLMFSGFLGFGWESQWNNKTFAMSAGYDFEIWLNQLRIPTFQQLRLHGNLTLQGGTIRFEITF